MKDSRFCRAAQALLAGLVLLLALASCSQDPSSDVMGGGDENAEKAESADVDTEDTSSSVTVTDGEEKVVEEGETDPFTVNADWNKIDYVFDGEKLDNDWVLYTATFDNDNIPSYGFSSGSWTLNNSDTCEYYYSVPNNTNTAQGFSISSMKTYQYRGKNPFFEANSGYNTGTRVQRFRFYRMTGTALIVPLDQYLIAVDTYSKFVFAYGKITDYNNFAGQKIPSAYDAIENYGDYQFYEYDPIGYVNSDGTVTLYDTYTSEMKSQGTDYVPSIHDGYTTMADHSSSGEGRSPYYPGLYE